MEALEKSREISIKACRKMDLTVLFYMDVVRKYRKQGFIKPVQSLRRKHGMFCPG